MNAPTRTEVATVVACPGCGGPLPPVTVVVTAVADGSRVRVLSTTAEPLSDAWFDEAHAGHPSCRVRQVQQRARARLS